MLTFFLVVCISYSSSLRFYHNDQTNGQQNTHRSAEHHYLEGSRFSTFSEPATWFEAEAICTAHSSTLAILDNPQLSDQLSTAISSSSNSVEVWIGARRTDENWKWINGKPLPANTLRRSFSSSETQCLAFDRTFRGLDCSLRRCFVCQDAQTPDQTNQKWEESSLAVDGVEFTLYRRKVSFFEATAFCRSKGRRLAVVEGVAVARKLGRLMLTSRPSSERAWISGRYINDTWRWLSTAETVPTAAVKWHHAGPHSRKKTCLLLDRHMADDPSYVAAKCDRKFGFICETCCQVRKQRRQLTAIQNGPLVLVDERLSWADARRFCQGLGADLAEAHSRETLRTIVDAMIGHPKSPVHLWLGAQLVGNSWVWVERGEVKSRAEGFPWSEHDEDPGEACLNLDRGPDNEAVLYGLKCDRQQMFACENVQQRSGNGSDTK